MTQNAATYDTYDVIGNREALVDAIYKTDTAETPFLSAIQRVKTSNTNHEWQTDDYGSAATNYVIEADEATTNTITATSRLGNYCQISDKVVLISGTQMAMDPAGRANEMSYQTTMMTMRLKKDIEFALLDNNAKVQGNSTTAREAAGVPAWLKDNVDYNGATPPTGDGTDAWSGGTDIAITEGRVKSVLSQCYTNGGNPDILLANAFNKQAISTFGGNSTRMVTAEKNALHAAIDIYYSDFGAVKIVPSRHCETNAVYALDTKTWKYATLRDIQVTDLAKSGDYERRQILAEYTLQASLPKGNGIVWNVSAS